VQIRLLIKGTALYAEQAAEAVGVSLSSISMHRCKDDTYYCEALTSGRYEKAVEAWFRQPWRGSGSPGALLWFKLTEEEGGGHE
jgi:hypothetical protein